MTISNTSTAPLVVSNIGYPAGLSGNWPGGTIAPGASQAVTVGIDGNSTLTIRLNPLAPRTSFGPGQYRVTIDLPAGRYYAERICQHRRRAAGDDRRHRRRLHDQRIVRHVDSRVTGDQAVSYSSSEERCIGLP